MSATEQREGIGVTPEPEWFAKSEEEKVRHVYWACTGVKRPAARRRWWRKSPPPFDPASLCKVVHHSKEEAEAYATLVCADMEWDGKDAKQYALSEVMGSARRQGLAGVNCVGWHNGSWQVLKVWSAGQPLSTEDQGR